jgi:hypothetical protein
MQRQSAIQISIRILNGNPRRWAAIKCRMLVQLLLSRATFEAWIDARQPFSIARQRRLDYLQKPRISNARSPDPARVFAYSEAGNPNLPISSQSEKQNL